MKTILVIDVPAETGGALTILNQFYRRSVNDSENNWVYVTSTPKLTETNNVKNIRYPWIKKSWLHRLYFDNVIAPSLIKKYDVDEILSLQNVAIPFVNTPQTLYVHQPLPFIEKKFSFAENRKYWVYQNIISKNIFNSIKKSDNVIVQTEWMKEAVVRLVGKDDRKVKLESPEIDIKIKSKFTRTNESVRTFFYPAGATPYKNHDLILKACTLLKEKGLNDYKVIFTLKGDENGYASSLYEEVKKNNLPVSFVGKMEYEAVLDQYSKSVLIFPSYIETFGLPLLEARLHESPILSVNMPFSREILDGYGNVRFYESNQHIELANHMEYSITKSSMTILD